MPAEPDCYDIDVSNAELRQSEIISNLKLPVFVASDENFELRPIALAIVMTQDCDLLREYTDRRAGNVRAITQVLLYEVEEIDRSKALNQLNSKLWDPISKNSNERFHMLTAFPGDGNDPETALPGMLIDFRRYFTIEAREIARQIELGQAARRRCFLKSPYREHLQSRAAYYFGRVGLPVDHQS